MVEEQVNSGNKWTPKFMSEFSMGQYDFARYDKTLSAIDNTAALVTSVDVPSLELMQTYFAHLKNLYDNIKPIIAVKTVQDEMDDIVKKGKLKKRQWEDTKAMGLPMTKAQIREFVDLLDTFKTRLYGLKQVVGLGIAVRRHMSTAEKIRQGIHGNKDFDNLPEA